MNPTRGFVKLRFQAAHILLDLMRQAFMLDSYLLQLINRFRFLFRGLAHSSNELRTIGSATG